MTKLSIILYLADVVSNLSTLCLATCIISSVVLVVFGVLSVDPDNSFSESFVALSRKIFCKALIFCVIGFGGYSILPKEKTIYMIAAVECASAFTETETAKMLTTTGKTLLNDVSNVIHSYAMDAIDSKKKHKDDDE